jgi:sulfoxide reductase catalytic subunit YedY
MLIKIKSSLDIPSSEITPEWAYRSRREFLRTAAAGAAGAIAGSWLAGGGGLEAAPAQAPLPNVKPSKYVLDTAIDPRINTFEEITNYNNFYEFGPLKGDPVKYAGQLKVKPWTVRIDGLVGKPANYTIEDLIKPSQIEERVYRHRCVEGWSMVMPWAGIPLADVIKRAAPAGKAAFVKFTTLMRPSEMPGERGGSLPWPYVEGLRLDEAMHPLALLVVGLYGKELPNQDGAPLRLHLPWKYGFKSIKSIVRIELVETQPATTWAVQTPNEYGFYANVNPDVDHPRWTQKFERRIDDSARSLSALVRRNAADRPTLMFNGYADQVASLYRGMDLRKYF